MGSGKHTPREERRIILKMYKKAKKKKNMAEIAKQISRKKYTTYLCIYMENPHILVKGRIRKPRPRKTVVRVCMLL